jgi:putative membrane-bound dehydrogenase-like protein
VDKSVWCLIILLAAKAAGATEHVPYPKVLDDRYQLELIATEPDIVTPVGVAFDHRGRLLVIESHTHFPPKDYKGPKADRIRVLEETDGHGKARFSTFYEGSSATMGLAAGPEDCIYVATRMKVFRLRDTDGDGKADEEKAIAHLETKGSYPHDGLSGVAFDRDGHLYVGLGENLGEPYQLVGSDGTTLAGGGEGGNIYRCNADGSKLERIATGFWNPFGICIDPHGRIFAVDNDPDGRPPCRLVHVVGGGDYGFQFRYGRSGIHPLQAWDGELPGTLPLMAGTGEAPCAVLPYQGALWVTSWGDHRLERFSLEPVGASWRGVQQSVVQGDEYFRPVGLVEAPDGSLYFSDWVDRSYPVHGKGRIWRLRPKDGPAKQKPFPKLTKEEVRARAVESRFDLEALKSDDPFIRQAAVWGLTHHGAPAAIEWEKIDNERERLGVLQALRWKDAGADKALPKALGDPDPNVRLLAVRWVADRKLTKYRDMVAAQLSRQDGTPRLYRAALAALTWLDRGELIAGNDGKGGGALFAAVLADADKPPSLRAWAMRSLPLQHPVLAPEKLQRFLGSEHTELRREAVWTLALSDKPERFGILAKVAADGTYPAEVRADAAMGLAADAAGHKDKLRLLAMDQESAVRKEGERGLRGQTPDATAKPAPTDLDAWLKLLHEPGDADAGRRAFFSAAGARCSRCHVHSGRGNAIGPDLTFIGAQLDQRRLLESILQPSKEVAPEFRTWVVRTADGKTVTALSLGRFDKDRKERFADAEGQVFIVDAKDIEARRPSDISIMPDGLERLMTVEDLRDLIAFLSGARGDR